MGPFFFSMLTKKTFCLPGKRIQLCEYRSWQRGVPPEDILKHCGLDYHKRHSSIDPTDIWREAHENTAERRNLCWLSYFYTQRKLVWWDLLGLYIAHIQWGKPLNVVDLSETVTNLCKYESSKGHHCGIYIFIQKKLKIRPALKQIITVVSVQIFFSFFLLSPHLINLEIRFCFFYTNWLLGGRAPSSLPFNLPFLSLYLRCWNHFPAMWPESEDNVMCFSCGCESRSSRRLFWEIISFFLQSKN